jgi:hypothetical protein
VGKVLLFQTPQQPLNILLLLVAAAAAVITPKGLEKEEAGQVAIKQTLVFQLLLQLHILLL